MFQSDKRRSSVRITHSNATFGSCPVINKTANTLAENCFVLLNYDVYIYIYIYIYIVLSPYSLSQSMQMSHISV
jgi:hypothetical protein